MTVAMPVAVVVLVLMVVCAIRTRRKPVPQVTPQQLRHTLAVAARTMADFFGTMRDEDETQAAVDADPEYPAQYAGRILRVLRKVPGPASEALQSIAEAVEAANELPPVLRRSTLGDICLEYDDMAALIGQYSQEALRYYAGNNRVPA